MPAGSPAFSWILPSGSMDILPVFLARPKFNAIHECLNCFAVSNHPSLDNKMPTWRCRINCQVFCSVSSKYRYRHPLTSSVRQFNRSLLINVAVAAVTTSSGGILPQPSWLLHLRLHPASDVRLGNWHQLHKACLFQFKSASCLHYKTSSYGSLGSGLNVNIRNYSTSTAITHFFA